MGLMKRLHYKRKEAMGKKYNDPLLNERESTHGDYVATAYYTQCLRETLRGHSNWRRLSYTQRDALDNIALKLARIVVGDADFDGHWEDVIGYAKLGMTVFEQGRLKFPSTPKVDAQTTGRANKEVPNVGLVSEDDEVSFNTKVFTFNFVHPTAPTYEEVSTVVNQLHEVVPKSKTKPVFARHNAQRLADLSQEEYPAFLRSLYAMAKREGHTVRVNPQQIPKCEATQHSDSMVCNRCGIVYDVNDANPPTCPKTKTLCP